MPEEAQEEAQEGVTEELTAPFTYKITGSYYRVVPQPGDEPDRVLHVTEREVIDGVAPDDFARFVGDAGVLVKTNQGPMKEKIVFPLAVDNLEAAFEIFDGRAQAEAQRLMNRLQAQAQAAARQIVQATGMPPLPGQGPGGQIVMP